MTYLLIDTSEKLQDFLKALNSIKKIAVDFEGEFNLHIYGEHLCLIQIFDGKQYYLLDPRSKGIKDSDIVDFLTHPIEKVWFSVSSDHALIYKRYNIKIENIYDVQALATTLGFEGGLTALCKTFLNIDTEVKNKKALQTTNWLKRPLSEAQIQYALSDVEHLFSLQNVLQVEIEKKALQEEAQKKLLDACSVSSGKPGWTKICNWKKLSKEQQENIREYFIARDSIAKKYNVPAHLVLEKHKLVTLGKTCPKTEKELWKLVAPLKPRFERDLRKSLLDAFNTLTY